MEAKMDEALIKDEADAEPPSVPAEENNEDDETKAAPTPVPFSRGYVIIPERWLEDEEKLREAVWNVVSACKYAKEEKKLRLNEAILDIIIAKRSVKSAAEAQGIPFSTVQSYLRRCKLEAHRVFGTAAADDSSLVADIETEMDDDKDEAVPAAEDVQAAPPEAAAPTDNERKIEDISDDEIQLSIAEVLFTCHYTGDERQNLIQALQEAITGGDTVGNCADKHQLPLSTFHSYFAKLKTKLGVKVINVKKTAPKRSFAAATAPVENEHPVEPTTTERKKRKVSKTATPGVSTPRNIIIPEHWLQDETKLREAIWSVVSKSMYPEEEKKQRLNQAMMDIFVAKKSMTAAAEGQELPLSTVQSYYHRCRVEAEKVFGPAEGDATAAQSASADTVDGRSKSSESNSQNVTPISRPRQQPPLFAVPETPTTNQMGANDAMAQLGAAFVSSPLVQQCLTLQALMNNVGNSGNGGPLMNLMNESLKATLGQAMQSFVNAVNTTPNSHNISGIPAAPPPTPVSAVKKAVPHQDTPRPPSSRKDHDDIL